MRHLQLQAVYDSLELLDQQVFLVLTCLTLLIELFDLLVQPIELIMRVTEERGLLVVEGLKVQVLSLILFFGLAFLS